MKNYIKRIVIQPFAFESPQGRRYGIYIPELRYLFKNDLLTKHFNHNDKELESVGHSILMSEIGQSKGEFYLQCDDVIQSIYQYELIDKDIPLPPSVKIGEIPKWQLKYPENVELKNARHSFIKLRFKKEISKKLVLAIGLGIIIGSSAFLMPLIILFPLSSFLFSLLWFHLLLNKIDNLSRNITRVILSVQRLMSKKYNHVVGHLSYKQLFLNSLKFMFLSLVPLRLAYVTHFRASSIFLSSLGKSLLGYVAAKCEATFVFLLTFLGLQNLLDKYVSFNTIFEKEAMMVLPEKDLKQNPIYNENHIQNMDKLNKINNEINGFASAQGRVDAILYCQEHANEFKNLKWSAISKLASEHCTKRMTIAFDLDIDHKLEDIWKNGYPKHYFDSVSEEFRLTYQGIFEERIRNAQKAIPVL